MDTIYRGSERKLVVAFDIGTTFSGISYAVLDPGEIPKIRPVTRYPAQEHAGGDSKIPTIVYYDRSGVVRAAGAEALEESVIEQAEDGGWSKAEWFKLHLRPKTLPANHIRDDDIPSLPPGKTVVDVLTDFLRYMYGCARDFIRESHVSGDALWQSQENQAEFVLTHPNGWEGHQQSQMRCAAIQAGLVPEGEDSHSRLQFVTEGEASLHFCVKNNPSSIQVNQGVIVVDAGGGTVDLSAYQTKAHNSFAEIAPTECQLQGSIFVSRRAQRYLENYLRGSRYGTAEDVKRMAEVFDKTTKLKFRDQKDSSYIKFGSARDSDPRVCIRSGQLKIPGTEIAKFFEPSVTAILDAVRQQIAAARHPISAVFLVGGFAASDWLFLQLKASLNNLGVTLSRPDHHVNKAVSDGGVMFYLNGLVSSRVAKWTYGSETGAVYQPGRPDHRSRANRKRVLASGIPCIVGKWGILLKKVSREEEFVNRLSNQSESISVLERVRLPLRCYRGGIEPCPEWIDEDPLNFPVLCHVEADTSVLARSLTQEVGQDGKRFYQRDFRVVLLFGLTELKAQIRWEEKGVEKRGPATIVYELDEDQQPAQVTDSLRRGVNRLAEVAAAGSDPNRRRSSRIIQRQNARGGGL